MKTCVKCKQALDESMFGESIKFRDGLLRQCKACSAQYKRSYYLDNAERCKERARMWYRANKEKASARSKAWREKNYESYIAAKRKRYREDIQYRIAEVCRCRIRMAIKGSPTNIGFYDILGATIPELRKHIESQFLPGMSWDNHGRFGWHIDHIIPCASFNLRDPDEQKKCFHYTNLRPMWWRDNIIKSDKVLAA